MDVFDLQGMTTPVMVSGAAVRGGLRVGVASVDCPALGACRAESEGNCTQVYSLLRRFISSFQLQNRKCISS